MKSTILILLCLLANLSFSQTEKSFLTKEQSEIIFEKSKYFPNKTEIAIAFIKNGNVNFYGIRKESDTISKVDNQKSVFEIGSISKVFTSTLLSDFVINKKINLNDHINDFLKTPFNNGTKIILSKSFRSGLT